jgi:hypothetical protein
VKGQNNFKRPITVLGPLEQAQNQSLWSFVFFGPMKIFFLPNSFAKAISKIFQDFKEVLVLNQT